MQRSIVAIRARIPRYALHLGCRLNSTANDGLCTGDSTAFYPFHLLRIDGWLKRVSRQQISVEACIVERVMHDRRSSWGPLILWSSDARATTADARQNAWGLAACSFNAVGQMAL